MYELRGYVDEVEIFARYIVASAALRPKPPSNGMKGRLLAALLTHGPFLGAIAADFSPA